VRAGYVAWAVHELRIAQARGEQHGELLHTEDRHPVSVIVAEGVELVDCTNGVREWAASGDDEERAPWRGALDRRDCALEVARAFEQRAADISVDHPVVTQNYRAAHEIALRRASGRATTEELRRAMIHYRALFEELVGMPDGLEGHPVEVVEERIDRADIQRRRAS